MQNTRNMETDLDACVRTVKTAQDALKRAQAAGWKALCASGEFVRRVETLSQRMKMPVDASEKLCRSWAPRVATIDCELDPFFVPNVHFIDGAGAVITSVTWPSFSQDEALWCVYVDDHDIKDVLTCLLQSARDAYDLINLSK